MSNADWMSLGVLVVAVLTLAGAYLKKPTFVPAARVETLEGLVKDLQLQNQLCEKRTLALETQNRAFSERVEYLEGRVKSAIEEREYWVSKVRELERKRD